jgi:hypothetical protein
LGDVESRGAMVCGFCREKQILSPSPRGIGSGVFRYRAPPPNAARLRNLRATILLDIGRSDLPFQIQTTKRSAKKKENRDNADKNSINGELVYDRRKFRARLKIEQFFNLNPRLLKFALNRHLSKNYTNGTPPVCGLNYSLKKQLHVPTQTCHYTHL